MLVQTQKVVIKRNSFDWFTSLSQTHFVTELPFKKHIIRETPLGKLLVGFPSEHHSLKQDWYCLGM